MGAVGDEGLTAIPATYNAPESAQIGNATFMHSSNHLGAGYNGAEVEYNGDIWYKWGTGANRYHYISSKKASEIYGNFESYWLSDVKLVFCDSVSGTYTEVDASEISDIIIPQLNAPDEEQEDNAYISYPEDENVKYYYNGIRTFNCTDGTLDLYEWEKNDYRLFTRIPANELYAEHAYEASEETITDEYTVDWSTYDIDATVAQLQALLDNAYLEEWNYSTVKYQRTEVVEDYQWKRLVTEDDIQEKIYEGTAELLYSNEMALTGVSSVSFTNATLDEILALDEGKIKMTFTIAMIGTGTVSIHGQISRFVMEATGMEATTTLLIFNYLDFASSQYKTLYLMYDPTSTNPKWEVQF
jgi:hypothetical protein